MYIRNMKGMRRRVTLATTDLSVTLETGCAAMSTVSNGSSPGPAGHAPVSRAGRKTPVAGGNETREQPRMHTNWHEWVWNLAAVAAMSVGAAADAQRAGLP